MPVEAVPEITVTVDTKVLHEFLTRLRRVTGKAFYRMIRLVCVPEGLTGTTTNGTQFAQWTMPVGQAEGAFDLCGEVIVNAVQLGRYVKACLEEDLPITLAFGTKDLVVECGTSRLMLPGVPDPVDWIDGPRFPSVATLPDVAGMRLTPDTVRELKRAARFTSRDYSRPMLMMVSVEDDGTVVSTDSYRLSWGHIDGAIPGLIPAEVIDLMPNDGGTFSNVKATDKLAHEYVVVRADDGFLVTYRRDDPNMKFPSWRSLVPTNPRYRITLDRKALLQAIRVVSTALGGMDPAPMVLRATDDGRARIGLRSPVTDTEVSTTIGGVIDPHDLNQGAGFNPTYLAQSLRAFSGKTVTFNGIDALKPWVITDDTDYRHLIMPVRLS